MGSRSEWSSCITTHHQSSNNTRYRNTSLTREWKCKVYQKWRSQVIILINSPEISIVGSRSELSCCITTHHQSSNNTRYRNRSLTRQWKCKVYQKWRSQVIILINSTKISIMGSRSELSFCVITYHQSNNPRYRNTPLTPQFKCIISTTDEGHQISVLINSTEINIIASRRHFNGCVSIHMQK